MKSKSLYLLTIGILVVINAVGPAGGQRAAAPFQLGVWFSPKGGCTDAIINEIDQAHQQIGVLAYLLTANPIVKALIAAKQRGVTVNVVFDKGQYGSGEESDVANLVAAGVRVYMDDHHNQAHNKVMVIDGNTVITGSFNFTVAAEQTNAENLVIIKRADIAALYQKDINTHIQHAEPFKTR